jgi:hypothetical protein
MQLINLKTNQPVKSGDIVHCFRGKPAYVTGWQIPQHEGSTGRVYVQEISDRRTHAEYFPSVYNLAWVE